MAFGRGSPCTVWAHEPRPVVRQLSIHRLLPRLSADQPCPNVNSFRTKRHCRIIFKLMHNCNETRWLQGVAADTLEPHGALQFKFCCKSCGLSRNTHRCLVKDSNGLSQRSDRQRCPGEVEWLRGQSSHFHCAGACRVNHRSQGHMSWQPARGSVGDGSAA